MDSCTFAFMYTRNEVYVYLLGAVKICGYCRSINIRFLIHFFRVLQIVLHSAGKIRGKFVSIRDRELGFGELNVIM